MWYATRESVKQALDVKETARSDSQIDDALTGATDDLDGMLRRTFVPMLTTRKFDYPGERYARSWRLPLYRSELITVQELTSGGVLIPPDQFIVRRSDDLDTPPFDEIELLLSENGSFGGGPTSQQDVQVMAWYGYNDVRSVVGVLAAGAGSGDGTMVLDAGGSAAVGVGDLLSIGDERLTVTGRTSVDTGVTLSGDLANAMNQTLVPVPDTSLVAPGETITVDGERMLVQDRVGPNLLVRRGWDGYPTQAHSTGATVYAARSLSVERAASGTMPAAHPDGAAVSRQIVPGQIQTACRALALDTLLNERAGYARASGAGDNATELRGTALARLLARVTKNYKRSLFLDVV